MTINARRKATVRQFATVNGISYTAALRQFDIQTGEPLYAQFDYATDARHAAWRRRHGLTERTFGAWCFHRLASATGRVERDHDDCCLWGGPFYDHPATYSHRQPGERARLAVITFAPYRAWNTPAILDELTSITEQFDLRFRIGLTEDTTYGGGTVPIVIWNPRAVSFEAPRDA